LLKITDRTCGNCVYSSADYMFPVLLYIGSMNQYDQYMAMKL